LDPTERIGPTGTHFSANPPASGRFQGLVDFGPYQVGQLLGRGAMGDVYKVIHTGLGRAYALKLMAAELAWDEEAVIRFEREVQALARLDHPSVVRVHHSGRTPDGRPFCVMDLIEGGRTLADAVLHGVETGRLLTWIEEVAEGLGHAHRQGLVHRDVKPQNVLIDRQGRARLGDFGLVKSLAPTAESLTQTGVNVGTPRYMAPEQVKPDLAIGPQTDVFALGAVMFEFFSGKTPFEGGSALETYQFLISAQAPPPLKSGDAALDRTYGPLLQRALSVLPEDRPADGAAFAAELRALRASAEASPVDQGRSLVPLSLGIAALALAIFASLGGYLLGRRDQSPTATATASSPEPTASIRPAVTPSPAPAPAAPLAWVWEVGQTRTYELRIETEFSRELPRPPDPVAMIRTGADPQGELLAKGSEDPTWTVKADTEGAKAVPARIPERASWPTGPLGRSQWICPPRGAEGLAPGRYRYRTSFEFPKTHQVEGAFLLGLAFPDDHLREIWLNGEVLARPEHAPFQPFTLEAPIAPKAGKNVLEFVVENTGLEAGDNPTGLGLEVALLAQHLTQEVTHERFAGTRAYDLAFKAISVSRERVSLEVTLVGYRVRREQSENEDEPQIVLFDSARETGDDALAAAAGKQFRLEIDPRSGAVIDLLGSRRLQDSIDKVLNQVHAPETHCLSHSIPEFANPARLRALIGALWTQAPPAEKPGASTWQGGELFSIWLPLDFPAGAYPIRYSRDHSAVVWNGQGKVSRTRGSFENAGELLCEGRGRLEGGALVEARQTVSLEGKLSGDLGGEAKSYPFRGRTRTSLLPKR